MGVGGMEVHLEANLISKHPLHVQTMRLSCFHELLLKAPCLQHMSTFDKASPHPLLTTTPIFSCPGLRNEGANKLAFYVYLCVGVSGGRDLIFKDTGSQSKREEGREREKKRLNVLESRFFS